jgi:hypothetical protein
LTRSGLRNTHGSSRLRLLGSDLLQEGMVEKCFKINSVFGIAFEKVNKEMSELWGSS